MSSISPSPVRAFSLMEALITIAILGIVAAGAVQVIPGTNDDAKLSKLESDVAAVNQAVKIYLENGGSLDGLGDPQAVVDKLKARREKSSAAQFGGLRSGTVDKRLAVQMQTADQASTNATRAIWNAASQRFEITTEGEGGVAWFFFDDTLAAVDFGTEVVRDTLQEVAADATGGRFYFIPDN